MEAVLTDCKGVAMQIEDLIDGLNAKTRDERLSSLKKIKALCDAGGMQEPVRGGSVNNHIHTTYSFSPYSPTKAVYMAWINGLTTAGIMDHDSIAGAREFIEAGKIVGIATTIGIECRMDFSNTQFNGRRFNNPDQISMSYLMMHGVPHENIEKVQRFFAPVREKRNIRNRKMTQNINSLLSKCGIFVDFDRDIVPLSNSQEGGGLTERHILFAVSKKIIEHAGKGQGTIEFLKDKIGINLTEKQKAMLSDETAPYYDFDLLGILKSDLVGKFYIDAADECYDVRVFTEFCREVGSVAAYGYLGDVVDSVTGDKKAQKFEDGYLDELTGSLKGLGINAVTYAPTRNTPAQIERIMSLCENNGLLQVSGEDINTPRQPFVNKIMETEPFKPLIIATWALIGHEKACEDGIENGLFSQKIIEKMPDLKARIDYFYNIGKNSVL